jgi:hypothetical protein
MAISSVGTFGEFSPASYFSAKLACIERGAYLVSVQVKEFVKSYNALHEMGFTTPNVPELLAIHDNDPDKVIQHLLSSP